MSGFAQPTAVPALKNILYPTDFSPFSRAAIPYLRAIAARYDSIIHVVHVLAPEARIAVPMDQLPELDAEQATAQTTMKTLMSDCPFGANAHTETIERGPLWDVLAELIEEKSIDLVVLGTHGRRGWKKLVLGSVAEEVFRRAPCPVLTVGPQSPREGVTQPGISTILFATDFSSGSHHALPYAMSLARANHAHLILLHAVPPPTQMVQVGVDVLPIDIEVSAQLLENALARARRQIAELISAAEIRELKPEIVVESGPAADIILEIAKSKQADLLVMGAHRAASSIATHLPWATASEVVCQAHCPVLTVRS